MYVIRLFYCLFHRLLGTLKGYVANRARPEGSITEAYVVKECLTFCSMYVGGIETVFNREERNVDVSVHESGFEVFAQNVRPFGLITRVSIVSQKEREMAHWFVLNNSLELDHYLEYVLNLVFFCRIMFSI